MRNSAETPHGQPLTLRLDDVDLGNLKAVALLDGTSVAAELRTAWQYYFDERMHDNDLPNKVEAALSSRPFTRSPETSDDA